MDNEENIVEFDNASLYSEGADGVLAENADDAPDALTDDAKDAVVETAAQKVSSVNAREPGTVKGMLGNKTLEDVIEREAKEEQGSSSQFSLSRTLGGLIIVRFIQRQLVWCIYVSLFLIIYITLRYNCQAKMVAIERIERKIEQAKFKATVCNSQLTEQSRESNVLKRLSECGDSTLTIPNEPPYLIRVEEEE